MLDLLWAGMIITGIIYAAFAGNLEALTNGILDASSEAVALGITMLGIMSFWCGLMEVATKAKLIDELTKGIRPFVSFLFPEIPKEHEALKYISINMVANVLGLGWAATPSGLQAMKELTKLLSEKEKILGRASDAMCTFLVINISSLQLIPVNMIAYRRQYGSVNPSAVIGPGLLATCISTIAGICVCKLMTRKKSHNTGDDAVGSGLHL